MPVSRKKPSTEIAAADQATEAAPSQAPAEAAPPDGTDPKLRAELDMTRKKLAEAQCRADGNLALLQRVAADYENFKKFSERERAEAVLRERSAMLVDIIDSYENIERAIEAGCKELGPDSKLLKGLRMTLDLMKAALERNGVKPIVALGQKFDPSSHEAVYFTQDASKPEYSVAEELRRGYTLNGRVLRTSKVCVVTRPAPEPANDATECQKDDRKEE
jgi:molecular chaperone GrpE